MDLGTKLQNLRKESHLSQEGLAEKLNVSRQAVSKWESGSSYPEMEKLIEMTKIFDCTLDDLTNDSKTTETIKEQKEKTPTSDFVNDVTLFINKSVNMFTDMTGEQIFKLIFVMILLGIGMSLLKIPINYLYRLCVNFFNGFGTTISNVLSPLLNLLLNIIYIVGGFIVVYFVYKTQYLDKYEGKKDNKVETTKEEPVKEKPIKETKIESTIKSNKTSVGLSILNVLGKIVMFFVKLIAAFAAIPCIAMFIAVSILLVIFIWLIVKGVILIGFPLIALSGILLIGILIELLFDLIFSKKVATTKIFIIFIIGIFMFGIGIGITATEVTKYTVYNADPPDYQKTSMIETINMANDLRFNDYFKTSFIIDEALQDKVRIEVLYYKEMSTPKIDYKNNNLFIYSMDDEFNFKVVENIIGNLKDKEIYDYNALTRYEVKIYSSRENLETITGNSYSYNGVELITE